MTVANGPVHDSVQLLGDRDIAVARKRVSGAMDTLKARTIRKTRFVTAVSEIARNAVMHGGGGTLMIYLSRTPPTIAVVCTDNGPGIRDVEEALRDGFSTAKSMGRGLGGAKRLVDHFEITSAPGQGTTVTLSSAA